MVNGSLIAAFTGRVCQASRQVGAGRCSAAYCTIGISPQQYLAAVGFTHARPADTATTITIAAARTRSADTSQASMSAPSSPNAAPA